MKRTRFRSSPLFSAGLAILAAFSLVASHAIAGTPKLATVRPLVSPRVPGVVYVQFRSAVPDLMNASAPRGTISTRLADLLRAIGVTKVVLFDSTSRLDPIARKVGIDRMVVINYSANREPLSVAKQFLALSNVESASPRYIFSSALVPNDPGSSSHYAWTKLDLFRAWDISKGDSTIIIADCDEGTNYNHEDLKASVKINWGESGVDKNGNDKRSNGRDDDNDGATDNWHGWDVVGFDGTSNFTPDNDPIADADANSHGTMTAGCISGVVNNGMGLAGSGYLCKLLPIKIANVAGQLVGGYEGIHYAATHGARVINCSWGGQIDPSSRAFAEAFILEVSARNALIVAASGNFGIDNDIIPFFPANFLDVLSVGATGPDDKAASFSQYGHTVKVFAPGVQIYTTAWPGNSSYTSVDGTSFSSPLTAGIVGLIMSKYPDWPVRFIIRQIVQTCENVVNPANRNKYWGRVNAFAALSLPAGPGLLPISYAIDGVVDASFPADLTNHTLRVTFRNAIAAGTNLTARLVEGVGFRSTNETVLLGALGTLAEKPAVFTIARTGAYSEGTLIVRIALTDGGSYTDTISLPIFLDDAQGMALALALPAQYGSSISLAGLSTGFAVYGLEAPTGILSAYSINSGSWSNPEPLAVEAPYCVEAISDLKAFVGTGPSSGRAEIYSTQNGGGSWGAIDVSPITSFVNSVHFFNTQKGIFIGDPLAGKWGIGVTNDGGASWHAQTNRPRAISGEASWNNSACWVGQSGWFGTNKRRIWRTSDGGDTWKVLTVPYTNCLSIGFANVMDGIASFRPAASPGTTTVAGQVGLLVSHDGGASWSKLALPDPAMIPGSIKFIPNTTIGFLSSDRGIFRTDDFGANWGYLGVPTSYDPAGGEIGIAREGDTYYLSVLSGTVGIADYAADLPPVQSVSNTEQEIRCAVYPNPAASLIYVSFDAALSITKLTLFAIDGRQVRSKSFGGNEKAIALSVADLPSGTYTLEVISTSGRSARKKVTIVH